MFHFEPSMTLTLQALKSEVEVRLNIRDPGRKPEVEWVVTTFWNAQRLQIPRVRSKIIPLARKAKSLSKKYLSSE